MSRFPFATLVFRGARFEGEVMPLEVLPELAAYQELVLEVAKWLFRRAHPERRRLADHFESSFRLVLGRIEPGSAVPIIEREMRPDLLPFPPGWDGGVDYFEQARAEVERAIGAVGKSHVLPSSFPTEAILRFNVFGRGLRKGEELVVAPANSRSGAAYDKGVRKQMLLLHRSSFQDEVEVEGFVRAADLDSQKFGLRLDDGRRVEIQCPPLFLPVAVSGITKGDIRVRVKGIGVLDRNDRLLRVPEALEVSIVEDAEESKARACPTAIEKQLDALLGLPEEWLEAGGRRLDSAAVQWLGDLLRGLQQSFDLPTPYLYPTPAGHARAEWPTSHWETVAEIDPLGRKAELFAVHLTDDEVSEETLDFARGGSEASMGRFIADHLRG